MRQEYAVVCRQGVGRSINQDSYFVPDSTCNTTAKGWLFAVADGLGGHFFGDIASQKCCEILGRDYYAVSNIESIPHWFNDEIIKINNEILRLSKEEEKGQIATTLASLLIKDDLVYLNNVGDSRIYRFANQQLIQITEDHSVVWEYYIRHLITKEEMIECKNKHLITEAIGLNRYPRINSYILALPTEYFFMLCSDGLTDVVTDGQIELLIRKYADDLDKCSEMLYKLALKNGAQDDVTIILIQRKE